MTNSVSQNLIRLQNARTAIANKIISLGGVVSQNDGFEEFPNDLDTIPTGGETYALLFVTTEIGATVTVSKGQIILPSKTCTSGEELIFSIPENGTWTVSGSNNKVGTVSITYQGSYFIDLFYVYGVLWDGSSSTTFTRTDDASMFSNPSPAISGGLGSSPFDTIYPWSEMNIETFDDGNVMVKIPKFYYKITTIDKSIQFQITNVNKEGYKLSPAHRPRYGGDTERDYVYIGRYKCNSDYGSTTGQAPKGSITRATARDGCRQQGTGSNVQGYYQQDFALFWTIRMLYLVEFADWDSQKVLGYGGGVKNGSKVNTGTTDLMQYHTGTMLSSKTTYGAGVQYRNIEDLYGNCYEWCDGIRFSGTSVFIIDNPDEFSDSSNGVQRVTRPTNDVDFYIREFSYGVDDYDWVMYPKKLSTNGSSTTYIPDSTINAYTSSGVVLFIGGYYGTSSLGYGLFRLDGSDKATESGPAVGTRLMYLPPSSSQ